MIRKTLLTLTLASSMLIASMAPTSTFAQGLSIPQATAWRYLDNGKLTAAVAQTPVTDATRAVALNAVATGAPATSGVYVGPGTFELSATLPTIIPSYVGMGALGTILHTTHTKAEVQLAGFDARCSALTIRCSDGDLTPGSGGGGGGGSGTVTLVGLALPSSVFTVSGSPVSVSGTLTGTLATQTANKIWAGPTSGGVAQPAFRSLVTADLPDLSGTYQASDATLTALAAANWAANAIPIGSGADALSQVSFAANTFPARASTGNLVAKTITDFGLSLVDDADAATARATLGLGTLATQSGTFSGTSSGTNTGDQTTVSGNAGTATALQTARTINGVSFDGTANITVTAAGSTLSDTVTVSKGGTGDTSLTAYALLAGGTTSTGAVQSIASVGTTGQALISNGAGALPTFQTLPGGGDALTANPLSQFAATTSAQLRGVLTDESGTGVFLTVNGAMAGGTVDSSVIGGSAPAAGTFTTLVAGSSTSLLLGTAGSAVGSVGFRNATSGTATLSPPTGALSTYTVTLPNAASTLPIFPQQITFTGPSAARTITVPDASFTVARTDAGNTFIGHQTFEGVTSTGATGTGALVFGTSPAFVTPDLGTPSAGTLTNCTFPTLNQSTTGSAATLTTTRTIGGSNFNGSADVTSFPAPGAIGGTTPAAGTFTTLVAGSTTSLLLGTAGSAVGNIGFRNATSGTATLAPPTGALSTYTVTLPNAASTLPIFGQQITFAGPTAARTVTFPDAAFTAARTDAAQTFTGVQTLSSQPILSSLTASRPVATDSSKGLVSIGTPTTVANSAGTAYSLTNTSAALTFGTTQPVATVPDTGRYKVWGLMVLKYNGATFAADRTVTLKLRRTNNTAADLTGSTITLDTGVVTTYTASWGQFTIFSGLYSGTAADTITIFADVSTVPTAGSLDVTYATVILDRVD